MGVFVIASLLFKRYREKPRRPWRIWLFDVSKQVVGQMFVHGVNVLISGVVSHHTSANACVSYFLNILIDTTLGVGLLYLILQLLDELLTNKMQLQGFKSGIYGTPPRVSFWARQSAIYVLALTTMKLLVVGLLVLFPGIFNIGEWLLSWTWSDDGEEGFQVVFTMGLFPIIMNVLQFWLIDSIVKASEVTSPKLDEHDEHDHLDREPLFHASSDDEDDDDDTERPRHDIENPRIHSRSRSPARRSRSVHKDDASIRSASISDLKGTPPGTQVHGTQVHDEPHSYPPSLSSSLASASTVSSAAGSLTPKSASKPKRKEPPAALNIGRTTQLSAKVPMQDLEPHHDEGNDSWANWDDGDDWAERVGEEEWTGRRISTKKDELGSVWENPSPALVARKMD